MKSITYISQATSRLNGLPVPSGLAMVYARSRRANSTTGITSVLAYKNGYYLQTLEGLEEKVDSLFEVIKKDSFHKNLLMIFNHPIVDRHFPNWPMKLTSNLQTTEEFILYVESCVTGINNLDPSQLSLLELFIPTIRLYKTKTGYSQISKREKIVSIQYSLRKWPNFNEITPTPATLELCAKLVGKSLSHGEIYNSTLNQIQKQNLEATLNQLKKSGLLIMKTKIVEEIVVIENDIIEEKTASSLFVKFKKYLSRKVAI